MIDSKVNWLAKAEHYCAYQERSHFEVRMRLIEWGARGDIVEEILATLIQNNFLNEERFALAYCSGKFRMKGWGKIKIKQGLKLKKVSPALIQKALNNIPDNDYEKRLDEILIQKNRLLNESNPLKKRYKLVQFALGRGFEADIINQTILKINER